MDELYGVNNLYRFSYHFFEKSLFYLSSHMSPPDHIVVGVNQGRSLFDIPNILEDRKKIESSDVVINTTSNKTWVGQWVGCEGLGQKGWTAIVIATLELNRIQTEIESMQVGQGDNVIIVAKIPIIHPSMSDKEYIEKFRDNIKKESHDYLKNLKEISSGLGMIIKLEETWYSTVLLNYGKEILFDGAYMQQGRTLEAVNGWRRSREHRNMVAMFLVGLQGTLVAPEAVRDTTVLKTSEARTQQDGDDGVEAADD